MRELINKIIITSFGLVFPVLLISVSAIHAQSCDIMYFCEDYEDGEVNCSDRFSKGEITVVVRLSTPIHHPKMIIQLDKYDPQEDKFEFYSNYEFDTDTDMTYIYFPGIAFEEEGIFRIFLLDLRREIITSALIEII